MCCCLLLCLFCAVVLLLCSNNFTAARAAMYAVGRGLLVLNVVIVTCVSDATTFQLLGLHFMSKKIIAEKGWESPGMMRSNYHRECNDCCNGQRQRHQGASADHLKEPEASSAVDSRPGTSRIAIHHLGLFPHARPSLPGVYKRFPRLRRREALGR